MAIEKVPVWEKANLSLEEAAAYFGIGINKLRDMTNDENCSFVLWKNSRFFTAKKKVLTKSLAAALLENGRAPLKGCYSEKTGKTYDASVLLEDDGQRTGYKMVFDNG